MHKLIILSLFSQLLFSTASQDYCYSTDANPYRQFGTKTSYLDRGGKNDTGLDNEGCEPVMIYLLARHGYRYPGDDDIEEMQKLLSYLKQHILNNNTVHQLCEDDVTALRNWTLRMVPQDDKKLSVSGQMELQHLASRYRNKLPSLLHLAYAAEQFKFRHTDKERTKNSAEYFARGLFASAEVNDTALDTLISQISMEVYEEDEDFVLRYYKNCRKFEKTVDEQPVQELVKFEESQFMLSALQNVSSRLGLTSTLNKTSLLTLWRSCSMEHGIYDQVDTVRPRVGSGSPWCAAFTASELNVLNYMNDLEDYWLTSYGHVINYEQTCPLVQDIVKWVRLSASGNSSAPKVVLRFAHSKALATLIAKIGLNKDSMPLTSDGYETSDNRMWRDSYIVPMAANIAFVVYNCSGTMKFKMVINEQETLFPGCEHNMCDINTFMSSLGNFADTCNFDKICEYNEPKTTTPTPSPATRVSGSWIALFAMIGVSKVVCH